MEPSRYENGLKTLGKITGVPNTKVAENLKHTVPELADWIIEFAYGEVLSRDKLDLKTRQIATVAALTAMGTAPPQLKAHISGALNVGSKQEEIVEVIVQMAVYAGFPAALNGISAAKEVFQNREES